MPAAMLSELREPRNQTCDTYTAKFIQKVTNCCRHVGVVAAVHESNWSGVSSFTDVIVPGLTTGTQRGRITLLPNTDGGYQCP
eukprot:NODE_1618_length_1111_cov_63.707156_g1320_i0.p2 GENE.NODE_1618_length_1111_cov_63.707156_g1320_i0~~NODE_1618_length_1111_cov_63.707156_g1320_i0.p2  ORF type:complete len:83 (-),score=0.76 NODE_1618_length_1111_cov_63.707156_g1320_i0:399-647(-)